jgi:hypothetical protein
VALEVSEVEAGTSVADVAVGAHQILRAVAGAEPGQGGAARILQSAGGGVGAEPVENDQAPIALAELCELLAVPGARRATQQQL